MNIQLTSSLPKPLTDIQYLQQQIDLLRERIIHLERQTMIQQPAQPNFVPHYSPQPYEILC